MGDHFKWWDSLSGRTNAIISYNRLSSIKGYPEIYIRDTDAKFLRLYSFLIKRLNELSIIELHKKKIKPNAIVRLGGSSGHKLQKQMPPEHDVRFVSETLPILFMYTFPNRENIGITACSLGDLRRWIEDSRNKERFLVATLLVGLLSIIVVFFGD